MLKVSVTAAPEKGKATEAVIDVLCEELSLARWQVELVAGATSRQKQFLVQRRRGRRAVKPNRSGIGPRTLNARVLDGLGGPVAIAFRAGEPCVRLRHCRY